MSQSPLMPVGKRLRTMEESDSDESETVLMEHISHIVSQNEPDSAALQANVGSHDNQSDTLVTSKSSSPAVASLSHARSIEAKSNCDLNSNIHPKDAQKLKSDSERAIMIACPSLKPIFDKTEQLMQDRPSSSDASSRYSSLSNRSQPSSTVSSNLFDGNHASQMRFSCSRARGNNNARTRHHGRDEEYSEVGSISESRHLDQMDAVDIDEDSHNWADTDDESEDDEQEDYDGGDGSSSEGSSLSIVSGSPPVVNDDDSLDLDSEEDEVDDFPPEEYLKHDPTPDAPYPKPNWITTIELRKRKLGLASSKQHLLGRKRPSMYWFEKYASDSLWMIQRLTFERELKAHTGAVNCLNFNSAGNLLCSGSDDLSVCIWDWQMPDANQLLRSRLPTGHVSNVFQCQFCNGDTNIVTSSRDGTVRLLDLEKNQSDLLLSSNGEIGKVAFVSPSVFVTCGTNANVYLVDLREKNSRKLFTVRSPKNNNSCRLHTIDAHPIDKHKIAVAGSSPFVFLYDLRRVRSQVQPDTEAKPTYCIGQTYSSNHIITSTAFNSTGEKILISYNDDDLYVCDTNSCKVIHRYQGHRNKRTIKGCTWFGDNYVMSGSDDGHIYGWDLDSEHIVCFLEADEGAVNCLEVHPHLPLLASSGFEHVVKIWEPNSTVWPQNMKGIKPQICKNNLRRELFNQRIRIMQRLRQSDSSENEL